MKFLLTTRSLESVFKAADKVPNKRVAPELLISVSGSDSQSTTHATRSLNDDANSLISGCHSIEVGS